MTEVWKDIEGYEGVYQISNIGRVKSLPRLVIHARYGTYNRSGKILKQRFNDHGYLRINLAYNKVTKDFYVHRLVAKAFVDNPNNFECVDHVDGDRLNNVASNLQWVTHSENTKRAYKMGLVDKRGEKHHGAILTDEKVRDIRVLYRTKILNQYQLADKYKISVSIICNICNFKAWKHVK